MDFDKSYLDTFVKNLQEDYDNKEDIDSFARESLTAEFDALKSEPIQFNKNDKIAFMGPAGCGKSSVLGKLAATMVFENNQKVKLITLDDFKMGAYDEIAAYADILGADLNEVTAEEIESEENVLTFIDTPATPVEKEKLDELKNKIDKLNPNYRFVVLSALIRSKDISHLGNMMKEFSPTHLVVTKTDLTQSYGAVLTAARATGLQIVYISNSPGGIGKLDPLDSAKLTETLFTNEEVNE
jgi:flagellar biosynthesis protein FlhF